ncbi:MAG: insulinase family protein, partial [Deltaproteobacteria bacterium]|nr:insulinase family protein [Deltaproteobacteria bacterium]
LVVVGDVDKTTALEEIRESFKDFKAAEDPHIERPVEPRQEELKEVTLRQPIKQTRIALAYHIPELKDKTTYAMDIITGILGEGVTSRLYKRLKVEEELVHTISTYAMTPKEPGLFLIEATLDADKVEKAVKEILVQIGRLSVEGPSPRELEKTKLSLESEFIYKRETMRGKARQLGYYETISGDLKFEEKYIRGIRAVSAQDVKAALAEYLVTDNLTFSMLLPEPEKDPFKKRALSKVVSTAESAIEKLSAKQLTDNKDREIKKVILDNGVTLIVKEDHSNQTVALYASFPGGLRMENMKTNGLGNFVTAAFKRGTTNRSRNNLAREIEDMAGSISGFSSRNTSGISATFLSRYFDRGLTVFADMLLNPAFEPEEVEKLRADILSSIKRTEDYLPGHTFKLLYSKLFNFHPYGMPVMGSAETVTSFTSDDLKEHYAKIFSPKRMVLTIVGDINTDHVIERVEEVLASFERKEVKLPKLSAEDPPEEIIRTGEMKEKEQTNIGIGFLGPKITDKDTYGLDILTEILSAQGGRLFVELRDKKSLAYAVSAFTRAGIEPGTFAIYIGCAPDKKDEAIEGILYELRRIIEEEVTDEELKRAKSAILGQYEMGLQKVSSQASNMATNEVLGLGFDYQKRYVRRIERVSKKDLLRAARKYITLDKGYIISIVGPNFKPEERQFPDSK